RSAAARQGELCLAQVPRLLPRPVPAASVPSARTPGYRAARAEPATAPRPPARHPLLPALPDPVAVLPATHCLRLAVHPQLRSAAARQGELGLAQVPRLQPRPVPAASVPSARTPGYRAARAEPATAPRPPARHPLLPALPDPVAVLPATHCLRLAVNPQLRSARPCPSTAKDRVRLQPQPHFLPAASHCQPRSEPAPACRFSRQSHSLPGLCRTRCRYRLQRYPDARPASSGALWHKRQQSWKHRCGWLASYPWRSCSQAWRLQPAPWY